MFKGDAVTKEDWVQPGQMIDQSKIKLQHALEAERKNGIIRFFLQASVFNSFRFIYVLYPYLKYINS
jgi:hypothetical protein